MRGPVLSERLRTKTEKARANADALKPADPVFLCAAIGPNPASVAEAIWALRVQRELAVIEAHLVSLARGHHYLRREMLGSEGVFGKLRARFPDVLVSGDASIVEHRTVRTDGTAVDQDENEADAAAYRATVWAGARACIDRAGAQRIIFVLAGGRQRTTTAYATTMVQLLARTQDELVDVRVSDPRAEGGSGFYFPDQAGRYVKTDKGLLDARSVKVTLVPVTVPRLGGLLEPQHLVSFETALDSSRLALEALEPPRLVVDLASGIVHVNGERVPSELPHRWRGTRSSRPSEPRTATANRERFRPDAVPLFPEASRRPRVRALGEERSAKPRCARRFGCRASRPCGSTTTRYPARQAEGRYEARDGGLDRPPRSRGVGQAPGSGSREARQRRIPATAARPVEDRDHPAIVTLRSWECLPARVTLGT